MIGLMAITLSMAAPAGQAAAEGSALIDIPPPANAKRICRREVPTGSIMLGKKICLTASQWRSVNDVRSTATDAFLRRPVNKLDDKTLSGG